MGQKGQTRKTQTHTSILGPPEPLPLRAVDSLAAALEETESNTGGPCLTSLTRGGWSLLPASIGMFTSTGKSTPSLMPKQPDESCPTLEIWGQGFFCAAF